MANSQQPPHTVEQLVERVRTTHHTMSPQFQIAARHLIDNLSQVPVESMRKIANRAGVQPATLVRLAKSLGFDGWDALRQVVVQGLHSQPRSYAEQAREVVRQRSNRSAFHRQIATHSRNLGLLEEANDTAIRDAARRLSRARHIHIAGFRASHSVAHSLYYLLRLFRHSVSFIRAEGGLLELELRPLDDADAVVIIAFSPYSQEAMRVAEAAHARGCGIIAICDSKVAPVARHADVCLVFPTDAPTFFPSVASATLLVESLATQVLARAGSQGVKTLNESEKDLHRSGAYLCPKDPTGEE